MLNNRPSIALLALPALLLYLYAAVYYRRFKQFANYPQVKPSLIWGHLKITNEFHQRRDEKGCQIGNSPSFEAPKHLI